MKPAEKWNFRVENEDSSTGYITLEKLCLHQTWNYKVADPFFAGFTLEL